MDLFQKIKDFKMKQGNMIKDCSIKSYVIICNKIHGSNDYTNLDFLEDEENVMNFVNSFSKLNTRKNYLSGVIVALESDGRDNSNYKKIKSKMEEDYSNFIKLNKKTETQEKNWFSVDELKKIVNDLGEKVLDKDIFDAGALVKKDILLLQDYMIGLLYTEMLPVRLDFAPMFVVRGEQDLTRSNDHNYLVLGEDKKFFILNQFKNSKIMGRVRMDIPPRLSRTIDVWLKHNHTGYFLINSRGGPLSENGLGKIIKRIFTKDGKSATVNIIRHIFETENINLPRRKREQEFAKKMLHSDSMQLQYAKF